MAVPPSTVSCLLKSKGETCCLVADARAQSPCAYFITPTRCFPHLDFGHQMPLGQASLQLQQLSIGAGLIGARVNALVHWPAVWEPAFPLHGSIHPTAVLAVPVYDVRLLGPVWIALGPLCTLQVQNGAHPLPAEQQHICHYDLFPSASVIAIFWKLVSPMMDAAIQYEMHTEAYANIQPMYTHHLIDSVHALVAEA